MSGSQRCKHAWLVVREVVVSASVRRRVFLGLRFKRPVVSDDSESQWKTAYGYSRAVS